MGFTNEEDTLLILGVNKHGMDYEAIRMEFLPKYTEAQLRKRFSRIRKRFKIDDKRLCQIIDRTTQDKEFSRELQSFKEPK